MFKHFKIEQKPGIYKFKRIISNPIVIIVIVILSANILFITNIFNPNPLITRSGLAYNIKPGLISGYHDIDPNDGFTTQALGKQAAIQVIHGHLPYWNYNEGIGTPLLGEMQSSALFPLDIFLLFGSGMTYMFIFLELIAAISTYYLLKKLKIHKNIAIVGGVLFGLSSLFVWFWSANAKPVAFLPLLILGIENIFVTVYENKKIKFITILILPIAIALSLYAGFPEVAYLDGLFGLGWSLVRLVNLEPEKRLRFLKILIPLGLVGTIFAYPIIISFIDYYKVANVGMHHGQILSSLTYAGLPALIMPYIYGPIFGFSAADPSGNLNLFWGNVGGYASIATVYLAIMSLINIKRDVKQVRMIKVYIGVISVVLIMRIYGFPGMSNLLAIIPGVGLTAIYRYSVQIIDFGLIVLSAFALEQIIYTKKKFDRSKLKISLILTTLIIVLTLPIANHEYQFIKDIPTEDIFFYGSLLWSLSVTIVIALIANIYIKYKDSEKYNTKKKILQGLLICVVVLDSLIMFILPQFSSPRSAKIDEKPINYLKKNIGFDRFYTIGPISPNYSSYFGVSSINMNDLPSPSSFDQFWITKLNNNSIPGIFTGQDPLNPAGESAWQAFKSNINYYEFLSVKYLLTYHNQLAPSEYLSIGLKKVYTDNVADIYLLPKTKSYFFIKKGNCFIHPISKSLIKVNCVTPSELIRRELYMSGWSAYANKKELNVKEYKNIFQLIYIPKGQYEIKFEFIPKYLI